MEFGDGEIDVFPEAIKVELPDESLDYVEIKHEFPIDQKVSESYDPLKTSETTTKTKRRSSRQSKKSLKAKENQARKSKNGKPFSKKKKCIIKECSTYQGQDPNISFYRVWVSTVLPILIILFKVVKVLILAR